MFLNVGSPLAYRLTLSELRAQGPSPHRVRVSGTLVEESVRTHPETSELLFEISNGEERLEVRYHGSRPDMLGAGVTAMIEGRYLPDGHLEAEELLLKSPSKSQTLASSPSSQLQSLAPSGFCDGVSEIPRTECEALEALYSSMDGPNWGRNDDWLQTITPCSWYGVVCDEGHVTALELFRNGLSGTIPSELGDLPYLGSLVLSQNTLSGAIPDRLADLTALSNLYLNTNQLNGEIPSELGDLTGLTRLVLKSNRLRGEVPDTIVRLVNLRPLSTDLAYNMLTASDQQVIAFLNEQDPDWAQTQTVPPTGVHVETMTENSVQLAWVPVNYGDDYEIGYSNPAGGVVTATVSISEASYVAEEVSPCASERFTIAIRTRTYAHGNPGEYAYNQSNLRSDSVQLTLGRPLSPTLSRPSNGGSTCDSTPTFTWNPVDGATSYRIQVDNDGDFSSPEPGGTVSTTSYTSGSELLEDVTYYWHVRASNLCGDGSWSEVWEFTVRSSCLFLPFTAKD